MELSILLAMFVFSLTMSITPGPVNMVILSSGVNYGIKQTIPYVSGATIGFTLLLLCIGLGFYQFIQNYPNFLTYLAIGGSFYIAYMGYKIAISKPEIDIKEQQVPKFHEGFVLQWINPKAWIACVSGVSIFSKADSYSQFLTFSVIYFLVCYGSLGLWAIFGQQLSGLLKSSLRLRLFNLTMGALLVGTAAYLGYSYF
jgi:threonine/homoserine/homoserine lactone efflux protein